LVFDFYSNSTVAGSTNTAPPSSLIPREINNFQFTIPAGFANSMVTVTAFLNGVAVTLVPFSFTMANPGDGTVFIVQGIGSNFDEVRIMAVSDGSANGKNLAISPLGFTEFNPSDVVMELGIEGTDGDGDFIASELTFGIDQDGGGVVFGAAASPAEIQAIQTAQPAAPEPNLGVTEVTAETDTLIATSGSDVFAWELADLGQPGSPGTDTIQDFGLEGTDALDLSDLLVGVKSNGTSDGIGDLEEFLSVSLEGSNTVISISSDGGFTDGVYDASAVDQTITLLGVDLGSDSAAAIKSMLDAGQLITD